MTSNITSTVVITPASPTERQTESHRGLLHYMHMLSFQLSSVLSPSVEMSRAAAGRDGLEKDFQTIAFFLLETKPSAF